MIHALRQEKNFSPTSHFMSTFPHKSGFQALMSNKSSEEIKADKRRTTAGNKKTRLSPEPLEPEKKLFKSFDSVFEELSVETEIFQTQ